MKVLLKFLSLVLILVVVFILTSTMFYSHNFRVAGSIIQMQDVLCLLVSSIWIALTVYYVQSQSHIASGWTVFRLFFSLLVIYALMPQIENLLFTNTYALLDTIDIISILTGNFIPVAVAILLGMKFFKNNFQPSRYARELQNFQPLEVILKFLFAAFVYVVISNIYNYFAYVDHSLRQYLPYVLETWKHTPQTYLIDFVRGLVYVVAAFPIIELFKRRSFPMWAALALVLEMPVVYLLIPDSLFPDTIRTGDIVDISHIQFLFACTTFLIFDKIGKEKRQILTPSLAQI